MAFRHVLLSAGWLLAGGIPVAAWSADCTEKLPSPDTVASARDMTARDLVELRDIGPVETGYPPAKILAMSPDKTRVAFQVRQAQLDSNSYCFAVLVLDLTTDKPPVAVNIGGDYIPVVYPSLGYVAHTPPGMAAIVTPQWSPDGVWLTFLRRDHGVTQVWRAKADGSFSEPVTRVGFDVLDFMWAPDGRTLIYSGRPALVEAQKGIEEEGAEGWLYDDRFEPVASSRPQPREPIPIKAYAINLSDGEVRLATPSEESRLIQRSEEPDAPGPQTPARGRGRRQAWIDHKAGDGETSSSVIYTKDERGRTHVCSEAFCTGARVLWWSEDGRDLIVLRRGLTASATEIFRWRPNEKTGTLLVSTEGEFMGCEVSGNSLICGYESSIWPRHVIRLDLASGGMRTLYDPNPQFAHLHLGGVERLKWTNDYGVGTFADLVLPPDHQPGQKHPLIVVQYGSRGFLRGGTGDAFPIQLYASRGYAVLSFQKPYSYGVMKGAKTWAEAGQIDRKDWMDTRSALSSLEGGVRLAISKGAVDENEIGITGVSEGALIAQFALIHTRLFKAAAVGNCCATPMKVTTLYGAPATKWFASVGFPTILDDGRAFWAPMSMCTNAAKINAPVLMLMPDREYLGALEGYTALSALGKPVEMYVYPDEYHVKWQPRHRYADYVRSLDWFDFWLRGKKGGALENEAQYQRWERLKAGPAPDAARAIQPQC